VTSWITLPETAAAIAAAGRSRRLSRRATTTALRRLRSAWDSVAALDADAHVCRLAERLATRHGLRGMDAVHLATALLLADARPIVVTWDLALRRAARVDGLAIAVT
jgi:hypothetical protein